MWNSNIHCKYFSYMNCGRDAQFWEDPFPDLIRPTELIWISDKIS